MIIIRSPTIKPLRSVPTTRLQPCHAQSTIATPPPLQLSFTTDYRTIDIQELSNLISRCHSTTQTFDNTTATADSKSTTDRRGTESNTIDTNKLRIALSNSLVCVAAYAFQSSLPLSLEHHQDQQHSEHQPHRQWWDRILAPPPKTLVGFARAASDSSLVATIDDVVVLPEVQRRGLGRRLIKSITSQLYLRDIIDIGISAPLELEPFFSACAFGDDSEQSVLMELSSQGRKMWGRQEEGARAVRNVLMYRGRGTIVR